MSEAVRAEVAALRAVAPRFDELARRLGEVASVVTERIRRGGRVLGIGRARVDAGVGLPAGQ